MAIIERSRGIFWGKNEVPFPKGSYLNRNTGDVFVYLDDGPRRSSRRAVIGRAASESTLYPNRNFRRYLPGEWSKNFGEEVDDCYEMHPGLYAAALGIGYSTGLYPLLCETLGPESANAVMDYSMYSILWKSDVSLCFKERMAGEVLFSRLRFDRTDASRNMRKLLMAGESREGGQRGMRTASLRVLRSRKEEGDGPRAAANRLNPSRPSLAQADILEDRKDPRTRRPLKRRHVWPLWG